MDRLRVFDSKNKLIFEPNKLGRKTPHSFGGCLKDFGYKIRKNDDRFHLLFRFDQDESGLPRFVRRARFLPLMFSFALQPSTSWSTPCYQVISDHEICVISPTKSIKASARPYPNYPKSFPTQKFDLKAKSAKPKNVKESLDLAGVFGLKHLSSSQREVAKKQLKVLWEFDRDFNGEMMTQNQFLNQWYQPLWSDIVNNFRCGNPDCLQTGRGKQRIIAILEGEPVEEIFFWSEKEQNEYVQIVFQQCTACEAIHSQALSD